MPEGIYIGFDFGLKRIGMAVGQKLTGSASPLPMMPAKMGIPSWDSIQKVLDEWHPLALIVGLPTCIDGRDLYTTSRARAFAKQLRKHFALPVHLVDERLTTVEARAILFEQGGYQRLKKSEVDSIAACIILEQWLTTS